MSQANVPTAKLNNFTDILVTNTAPSFAVGGGIVTTDLDGLGLGSEVTVQTDKIPVAVQADGKILLGGSINMKIDNSYSYGSALVRYNTDGSLDLSFDNDGIVVTAGINGSSVAVQADGKILLGGFNNISSGFALMRYNPDGSPDLSFDGNGIVTTKVSYSSGGASIAVQADGKILLGGSASTGKPRGIDFALVRYNTDGSLDLSFDGDGIVTTDLGNSYEIGKSVTVQADGKILLGGSNYDFALVRYNTDGSLDLSFDGDGMVTTDRGGYDYGESIAVQADGKILLGGGDSLMRYNTDGSLDLSFNNDGIVYLLYGAGTSVTVQADGKILLDGSLVRYNSDGSPDLSFGTDGIATSTGINGRSVTVQTDGKILLGGTGTSYIGSGGDFALVRYNTDGSLDYSFNPNPVNTLNSQTICYYNDYGSILDNAVQIYDAELAVQGNYNGATVTLARHGGANAEDVFSGRGLLSFSGSDAVLSGVTIGAVSNSNGTLSINFNNNATPVRVDTVLSSIAYSNTADYPLVPTDTPASVQPTSVQIDWTFSDGNTGAQGMGDALTTTGSIIVNMLGNRGELRGTTGDDHLLGNWSVRKIYGFAGNDYLAGRHRNDTLDGGEGNDTLSGGSMQGGLGDDTYFAYQSRRGRNVVIENPNEGADTINSYSSYNHLPDNIENLTLTTGSNGIYGKGNDLANTLIGNDQDNFLTGGAGADTLSGGLGADQFKFNTEAETGITATTRDTIVDFSHEQGDKINLSAFDANTAFKGNNTFAAPTVGDTFSGTFANSGVLFFDQTAHILYGNNDTDIAADFSIMVMGVTNLVAADFVL